MSTHKNFDDKNPEYERHNRENSQTRQDEIADYVNGEMASEEAAAFERRMQEDECLRRDVEQWRNALQAARDWMSQEAPGVERVAKLKVPSLTARSSRTRVAPRLLISLRASLRSHAWRGVAAAAIFLIGFLLGSLAHWQPWKPAAGDRTALSPSYTKPDKEEPSPLLQQAPETPAREVASLPSPRYTLDQNGRITIETSLSKSSSRALWIVDGSFQLAQSSKGEK